MKTTLDLEKALSALNGLEKAYELSKKGKPLKAEFVRDDLAGGKFYGYRGRGTEVGQEGYKKIGTKIRRSRGRYGSVGAEMSGDVGQDMKIIHVRSHAQGKPQQQKNPTLPKASAHSALGGSDKVARWRQDSHEVLSGAQGVQKPKRSRAEVVGAAYKPMTDVENTLARLVEAEAQYLKVKHGTDYGTARSHAVQSVRRAFEKSVMEKAANVSSGQVVYDPTQNTFIYSDGKPLSERDTNMVNRVLAQFKTTAERIIKAKTTAVRREKGSDE